MTEELTIITERVDDTPLLLAYMERMGLPSLLDEYFPTHWLAHILSEGNHRLSHVQPWAEKRLESLRACIGPTVRALDFSDDRLGDVLSRLSQDDAWERLEATLNGHLLRVYDFSPQRVRLDSTASGYGSVTPEGLFQFGHSKDHRPDLPQVKGMLATLDPLGMPVATMVLPGQRADDPLYILAITQVRRGVGRRGLLYIGDCKMGALATRAFLQAGGDFYLCPLSEIQMPADRWEEILAPVWSGEQALTPIYREQENGERVCIAEELERREVRTAQVDGRTITWSERQLVVRSLKQARAMEAALRARLEKAQKALAALNERRRGRKRFSDEATLRQAAEAMVARYQVQGLLHLKYEEEVRERPVRRYRGRPATVRQERAIRVRGSVDEEALEQAVRRLGWRVYVTNEGARRLSLEQAVLAYREQYTMDRGMGRLKGRPLSLTPMYLQRDDRITGLIRLLTIALRVLTLLEWVVRRNLAVEDIPLTGLYAGNPKRATRRPTAERLLEAFQDITWTILRGSHPTSYHLTPLSPLQQRILALLGFSPNIYATLCTHSAQPP